MTRTTQDVKRAAPIDRVVWVCRHGHRADADPQWKRTADRPYDPPLSERGRAQSARLGERLATEGVEHVVASPFRRAAETACIAAGRLGLKVKIEPGLSEWLRDEWFEKASPPLWLETAELDRLYGGIDPGHEPIHRPGYPESHEVMLARTAETTRELLRRYGGDLLLIGHGASVGGASRGVLGAPGRVGVETPLCCLVRIVRRRGIWGIELTGEDESHLGELCAGG